MSGCAFQKKEKIKMDGFYGLYEDLHSDSYHNDKKSISRSALMDFHKSPYTYWAKHLNAERPIKDSTQPMILGSAFHTLILEPGLFGKQYIVAPYLENSPKKVLLKHVGRPAYEAYKAEKAKIDFINTSTMEEFEENAQGKTILSIEELNNLYRMRDKLKSNLRAIELIEGARIENSFFWKDESSKLLLKCRPDILHDDIIVDLKTTSDASPRAFQMSMILGGYHLQMAMIRDAVEALEGRRINVFVNIVIETKYPYNTAIYILDEFAIEAGETKYKTLCLELKSALDKNEFPDYGVQTISLPKWAL